MIDAKIIDIKVQDIRFPTSLHYHGSDAMHTDPDYSCAYVTIITDTEYEGYGLTFTLGRGTEIVVLACKSLFKIIKNKKTTKIFSNFALYWRKLTCDTQLRWIGPEKGVIHLATAAIVNALWDLWARIENKPVWKLLTDMSPKELVSTIDFRYIKSVVTKEQAIQILENNMKQKEHQESELQKKGFPAYTTQVGWLGYSDEQVVDLCNSSLERGFTAFKIKVGQNLDDDIRRCEIVRRVIGPEKKLMLDANQVWEIDEAVEWIDRLAIYKPFWVEEPTSPDDSWGHGQIRERLKEKVKLATGEMCANRVMFRQFLEMGIDYCQIDAARIGGINEILAVYFMAHIKNLPICPHAGGVGLCEMVQHLQMWDYICLSQTNEDRMIEYVDQQHEQFEDPVCIKNACYMPPSRPGYSTKLKDECILEYAYPEGNYWKLNKSE
ncbi:Mitochondrial enolase superfamily member 1 [Camponotus floridanus]|uniref:L-fuconate dehydratase n=1 Tax=Camponotus floridanus TaxID=104421 RepID=E2ALK9_CAMFO|nr:mitochondrial enolase superfamily member 1 [Camponotus floridanus]EFN65711.1 Mitochondrial enolase superfamily member 1 [Camponotus floridanus]